jgi:hypothetical protein
MYQNFVVRECLNLYLFQLKRLLYSSQRRSDFFERILQRKPQKFTSITLMTIVSNIPQNYGICRTGNVENSTNLLIHL